MLLNLLVVGCFVSVAASGRFTVRLIVDGVLSFAFIPIFQILAFVLVSAMCRKHGRFADSAGSFLTGMLPWLVWEIGVMAVMCFMQPNELAQWTGPDRLWILILSAVPFALWAAFLDFYFFREVLQRSSRQAMRDLVVQRAIAWTVGIVYFFAGGLPPFLMRTFS
jgi:hypothetical protein